ncbi:glucose-6-phosphate isomerase family protein [Clostridium sp. Marseille-P3244]|uniref:glucose-6-phosphate isomerase family protein n=1 Tax=Clostridium sp. Marseille-P3244 TaxID=1871020 RepID=UPI000931936F|nr:glucose-6-phosphate isomerase family protein [Clostridium sp. Marseille-P3244]
MKIIYSGLPIYFDKDTRELQFTDELTCAGSTKKYTSQMTGLLMNANDITTDELFYTAYRDIVFPEHASLFAKYDFRYDITAIEPGTVNNEFKKTSGHYHGFVENGSCPYPEVYEVICGEIIFVLQKCLDFQSDKSHVIDEIRIVHAKEGESVIIPPFYGHCSINPTEGISMFSNIAVVSCPLFYEPIQKKGGLAVYVTKNDGQFCLRQNSRYDNLPAAEIVRPRENKKLGIEFGTPCYQNFVKNPEKYDFLLHPEKYIAEMEEMTKPEGGKA